MAKKIEFAAWKKGLIEAWRAFVPAFLGVVAVQLSAGAGTQDVWLWGRSVIVAGVVAGVKAVAKWYREAFGQKDYSSWIYKLPL